MSLDPSSETQQNVPENLLEQGLPIAAEVVPPEPETTEVNPAPIEAQLVDERFLKSRGCRIATVGRTHTITATI